MFTQHIFKESTDYTQQEINKKVKRDEILRTLSNNKTIYDLIDSEGYVFIGDSSILNFYSNIYCDLTMTHTEFNDIQYGKFFY